MVVFARRNLVKDMRKNADLNKQLTWNLILQVNLNHLPRHYSMDKWFFPF